MRATVDDVRSTVEGMRPNVDGIPLIRRVVGVLKDEVRGLREEITCSPPRPFGSTTRASGTRPCSLKCCKRSARCTHATAARKRASAVSKGMRISFYAGRTGLMPSDVFVWPLALRLAFVHFSDSRKAPTGV